MGNVTKGEYPWAVVTSPLSTTLYVLARDPAVFDKEYRTFMLDFLKKNGFDKPYNMPLETYQGGQCPYNW